MRKTKKPIDWTAIERDYTKTSLSVRELARWYNCDEKAIRLRAKAGGWLRPGQENSAAPPPTPQPLDAIVAPIVERLREMAPDEPAQTPDIVERARRVALRMVDELETMAEAALAVATALCFDVEGAGRTAVRLLTAGTALANAAPEIQAEAAVARLRSGLPNH